MADCMMEQNTEGRQIIGMNVGKLFLAKVTANPPFCMRISEWEKAVKKQSGQKPLGKEESKARLEALVEETGCQRVHRFF